MAVALIASAAHVSADADRGDRLSDGEVHVVLQQPEGDSPEGIAVAKDGTVYVGNRRLTEAGLASEIYRIGADGKCSHFVSLGINENPDVPGVLGLGVDGGGDVWACIATFDAKTHGVWRFPGGGKKPPVRIAGLFDTIFPNAITFDGAGNAYFTDSVLGAIFRVDLEDHLALWYLDVDEELLTPSGQNPLVPDVGANGIAFCPPNSLYVANTERGFIIRFPITETGPGEPEIVSDHLALLTADGIAVDVEGNIHVAIPGFAVLSAVTGLPFSPLVKVDAETGEVTPLVTDLDDASLFDFPLSLAFGRLAGDHKSVYMTNGAFRGLSPVPIPEPGPGIVQVGVGVRGR
jgi:sugar lactone lactonase YvrE